MPEGPEVWILSKAINLDYNNNEKSLSYGKHLFLLDKQENWSFGLTGKVSINEESNELIKLSEGWLYGDVKKYEYFVKETLNLGIDFMTEEDDKIKEEVQKWTNSKKKLAALLLDQTKISGIGVAWGSEILYHSGLKPDLKACEQNLQTLADSILYIREKIKNICLSA